MIGKFKGVESEIHESCFIAKGSAVVGNVFIGKDSSVWYNAVVRGDMAKITIGEGTNIQDGSMLHCVQNTELIIGNNVTVGHGAILHSCTIGDDCLIGMGAIILDGAIIGNKCIIGAGALVTPNTVIPENSLAIGSPAKVKRELEEQEIENIRSNALEYIKLAQGHRE